MSTIVKIPGQVRTAKGSTACRRARAQGSVPANVYGHKQDPVALLLSEDAVKSLVRSGARVVDLEVDGKPEQALVKHVQWDTFSSSVLHVDFVRVDPDERVRVSVPIQLKGTAPGVMAGGVLEIPHHTVEVECLAVELPDSISVKIGALGMGGVIHVSDLTELPTGVTVVSPPETILVHIVEAKGGEEPAPAAADAAAPAKDEAAKSS